MKRLSIFVFLVFSICLVPEASAYCANESDQSDSTFGVMSKLVHFSNAPSVDEDAGIVEAEDDLSSSYKQDDDMSNDISASVLTGTGVATSELAAAVPSGAQTIADGVYEIAAASDPARVLDVVAGLEDPGTNVTLWSCYQAPRQRWRVSYVGGGYYTMSAVHSGQALDVVASGQEPGTNVTQWPLTGLENQQWVIQDLGDGSYRIVSRCNGLSLTSDGASDGDNVFVSGWGAAPCQRWRFTSAVPSGAQTIADGVYEIAAASDPARVLDVVAGLEDPGTNVTLWSCYQAPRQRWRVSYVGGGYYTMSAVHSGQALDVVASGQEPGTNVTQWPLTGLENQQWVIQDLGDGSYRIVSRCNGLSLTSDGASDGDNVFVSGWGAAPCQRWRFTSARPIDNGVYYVSLFSSSFNLAVSGGSVAPGANVVLQSKSSEPCQRFRIFYLDNGYYSIQALHSEQVLDVVASECYSGCNVTQWTQSDFDNQQWAIREVSTGCYEIVSRCNGLALTSADGFIDNSNIDVEYWRNLSNQQWSFTEAPPVIDGVYSICSASNQEQMLDVVAGSTAEGANVTTWDYDGCPWQRFEIQSVSGCWYKIIAVHSGQVLDVVASGQLSGTNVTQWSYFGNDNQLWKIVDNGDGTVCFLSKCNNLFLSFDGDMAVNGSNVCVTARANNEACQRFVLKQTTSNVLTTKQYTYSLEDMLRWQRESPYATYSDYEGLRALDPGTYPQDDSRFYRFADLRGYSGLTAETLDNRIRSTASGKNGTLTGCGSSVVAAAQRYHINEAFILSLAIVESGWGNSTLASGTYYDGNGFWDGDDWVSYPGYNSGIYYNFFGIGAYDSSAFRSGVKAAIANGWNSVHLAIDGGAKWIASNYIYSSSFPQVTLYEMRWDPDRSEITRARGWHQYSTNLYWDISIASNQMAVCYANAGYEHPNIGFIVPSYLQ